MGNSDDNCSKKLVDWVIENDSYYHCIHCSRHSSGDSVTHKDGCETGYGGQAKSIHAQSSNDKDDALDAIETAREYVRSVGRRLVDEAFEFHSVLAHLYGRAVTFSIHEEALDVSADIIEKHGRNPRIRIKKLTWASPEDREVKYAIGACKKKK